MGERYEFKGKIGQGGLGAVYKAYDLRMSRDVAIKRILANPNDSSISEEATRQLIKEAGALSALQHPNIVTIYDVGTDEDGPFVVMELLSGHTLEDLVSKGSFTWPDFRQFAMQTLEALIAAQELNLVHRDLKPTNIMVTWLPSGKFQVKIVDFGLAKLSSAPTLQTVDQHDGVFGSIYFMAPEQFERVPIDAKADLYAIGCVFYYVLTGTFPFDGDTAATVMASHLQHHVTHLKEVREGIPLWACDWVMWHINRYQTDRPESARQSLQFFLDNDNHQPYPELSTGLPTPKEDLPKRPRLVIPGGSPNPDVLPDTTPTHPLKTASVPKPILPPDGSKPSVHTTAQVTQSTDVESIPDDEPTPPPHTQNSPVPVAPIAPSAIPITSRQTKPVSIVKTSPLSVASSPTASPAAPLKKISTPAQEFTEHESSEAYLPTPKRKIPQAVKLSAAVVLGIIVIIAAFMVMNKTAKNSETKLYNEMIALAAKDEEVPVNKHKLEILLRAAVDVSANNDRYKVNHALRLAKASDDTDVDGIIATFATTQEMIPDVRIVLIKEVLGVRKNPSVLPILIEYSKTTNEPRNSVASLEAVRFMATESNIPEFLEIILSTNNDQIRRVVEENIGHIISKSTSTASIADKVLTAYSTAGNEVTRHSILRLLGLIGGDKALAIAKENLNSQQQNDKFAAITALSKWKTSEGLNVLIDFLSSQTDLSIRSKVFSAAIDFTKYAEEGQQLNWTLLASNAKTQDEILNLIRNLASAPAEPWNIAIIRKFMASSKNEDVIDLGEKVISHIQDRRSVEGEK
jgi:serine/threonine protein kinase/HEAT repeat protein